MNWAESILKIVRNKGTKYRKSSKELGKTYVWKVPKTRVCKKYEVCEYAKSMKSMKRVCKRSSKEYARQFAKNQARL